MALVKLSFKPGIVRDVTRYAATGAWWDGDYVRFHFGQPQSIGGWVRAPGGPFMGSCRLLHEWGTLAGDTVVAVGTHLKFYLYSGGAFYDITPLRIPPSPAVLSNPLSTTNGSNKLTVTHSSHGATINDFVTISGASGISNFTAAQINKEHQILEIIDGNSYRLMMPNNANSTVASGGGSVTFNYQINTGLDTGTSGGTGWGAGPWGGNYLGSGTNTTWGAPANVAILTSQRIGMWSATNYGEDLVLNQRDGAIYYWDKTSGLTSRAVGLATLVGGASVPQKATEVAVSAERHVIAFGADPFDAPGVQDKALIRFSAQESAVDWLPTPTNTAGDLRLVLGSTFVTHVQTTQEILVWSNTALHSMRYVGTPFVYGISVLSSKATIIGPKAKTVLDDTVYWMSKGAFFKYSGRVESIPCPIQDYVFNDLNYNETDKIYASTNSLFGEVMWFIPPANSSENGRCIIYNTQQNVWYYNSMSRTAWMDRISNPYPQAASGGYLYYHENGYMDGSTTPASAIQSYIESAPQEFGTSEKVFFASTFVPDVSFRNSTAVVPQVTVTLKPQDSPGGPITSSSTAGGNIQRVSTAVVEQFTDKVYVRLRGRGVALRVDCNTPGTAWRLGTPLLEGRVDGGRI